MKLGAEPKKLAVLAGLTLVAGYLVYQNVLSGQGAAAPQRQAGSVTALRPNPAPDSGRPATSAEQLRPASRSGPSEFRPSLKPRNEGERPLVSAIDPTLRLDLLARLQEVKVEGAHRNLFEFSAEPLPKQPEPKIIPKSAANAGIADTRPPVTVKPPPPPIPLRFYGYTTQARQGIKRAFFLDGEDIVVASEGDVVKRRYKVVRIGVNSVVVEDLEHKNEQMLPLVADVG